MSGIIWLASYPKSGNTWLRVFLSNLRIDEASPASINKLIVGGPSASFREWFDEAVGYASGELLPEEVERLRPQVYSHEAATVEETLFCKVHDAYTYLSDGRPLFPPEASIGAIYLIRNPLDVCVSYAHYDAVTDLEIKITEMADPAYALAQNVDRQEPKLRQRLLSWGGHVLSWTEAPRMRVHVMRYEDMKANPVETFTAAAAFAGLTHNRERIERAIAMSAFEELQQQEQNQGFREVPPWAASFFRKGEVGSWREALTEAQAVHIISDHREVMERFGYVTASGEPVF